MREKLRYTHKAVRCANETFIADCHGVLFFGKESVMAKDEKKLIANNKKAYHDYFLEEKYEAGVELHGTEVKSLRMGKCSIKE